MFRRFVLRRSSRFLPLAFGGLIVAALTPNPASADYEYEYGQSAILESTSSIEDKLACVGRLAVSLNQSPLESAYAESEIRDRYFHQQADRAFGADPELVFYIRQLLQDLWSGDTDDGVTEKEVAQSLGAICNEQDAYFIAGLHDFVRRLDVVNRKYFEEGLFDSSGCKARWESLLNAKMSKTCELFGDWTFQTSIDREAWRPISFTPWVREQVEWAKRSLEFSQVADTAPILTYDLLRLDALDPSPTFGSFLSDSLYADVQRLADEDSEVAESAKTQILWRLLSAADMIEQFGYREALREFRDSDQYRTDTRVRRHIDAILSSPINGFPAGPPTVMRNLMTQRNCYPFSSGDLISEMLPSICGFTNDAKGVAKPGSTDTDTIVVEVSSNESEMPSLELETEPEPVVTQVYESPLIETLIEPRTIHENLTVEDFELWSGPGYPKGDAERL